MSSNEYAHISNAQLMIGAFHTLENAKYFFRLSIKHYKDNEFQAAIPFATIALEEVQKGIELVRCFTKKQDMTG